MSNLRPLAVALALTLFPGLSTAWTPYGYGPYEPGAQMPTGPDTFDPGFFPGYGGMPPMGPESPDNAVSRLGGMRIEQSATDDAYLLTIQLSGVKPTEVKVEARGPWVLVTRDTSAENTQEESFSDGRGYRRSFSYSSGRMSRRFNVPRDGDTAAMQRQDTDDAIRITIPRAQPLTGQR
jgi:HSP20 family molecular chaperone IbpA